MEVDGRNALDCSLGGEGVDLASWLVRRGATVTMCDTRTDALFLPPVPGQGDRRHGVERHQRDRQPPRPVSTGAVIGRASTTSCGGRSVAGWSVESISGALRRFSGLPHRLDVLGTTNGVTWVDDSIATTPERVVAELRAFDVPVVLLLGGRDKGLPMDGLRQRRPDGAAPSSASVRRPRPSPTR